LLFTNFSIENNTKEILTFKLDRSLENIKYNCNKLTTKVNKRELKCINKKKSVK